jgi:signal peptidase I
MPANRESFLCGWKGKPSMKAKENAKKIWKFIWEDDSIWSWMLNIVLAFVLIKFIVYPSLGLLLGTSYPVVAVVSESMEHNKQFNDWWENGGEWYSEHEITKEQFAEFKLRNGFNKGDIIVLTKSTPENTFVGDIIVFRTGKPDPIIHRVVAWWSEEGNKFYMTKGDNYQTNKVPIRNVIIDETRITENQVIGKALFKIPFLGYIKIWFVDLINLMRMPFS